MNSWGSVPAGSVLPFMFDSFAGATGASITLTGLAITDVEIYKGISMTQRTSDAGVVLMDTDGIDLDGVTGIHGFSIDTGDNTDAGFYAVGSFFTVVVSAVTIDGQTVNFVAGTFRLLAAETAAGVPQARASAIANGAIAAATFAASAIDAAAIAADAGTEIGTAVWATAARTLTALDEDTTTLDLDATIRAAVGLAAADLDTQLTALPTNAELATALGTADDAVLLAIGDLPTNAELATALGTADDAILVQVAAVKAKTDQLIFTKANEIDANVQSINGVTITGDGQVGTEFGV